MSKEGPAFFVTENSHGKKTEKETGTIINHKLLLKRQV
jgi:hypothetical protein